MLYRSAALAAVIIIAFFVTWELFWRSKGYVPTLNDSKNLFAQQWSRLDSLGADDVVLVGASRIRFDIDLQTWESLNGHKPLLLGVNGAAAWPILEAVAHDSEFAGTVVINVAPNFFWEFQGAADGKARTWIAYAQSWSPAQRASHRTALILEHRLAFLQQDDLSYHALASRLEPPPDRAGAVGRPPFPPMLALIDEDARERMLPKLAEEKAYQVRVQKVWSAALDHSVLLDAQARQQVIDRVVAAVKAITGRGGNVFFLRLPSTGEYRERENELWPRAQWWDPLVLQAGVPGIHFEDYPELRDFTCPEWSHLNQADAVRFTEALLRHTALGAAKPGQ